MLAFCDRCTCSVSLYPPQAALDSAAPYRGAFQAAAPRKASPARGGAAAGGGGVRRLALPLSFRATSLLRRGRDFIGPPAGLAGAGACRAAPGSGGFVGRAFPPAAWGLRHRKAHGTMQASSPTDAGQSPAGVWAPSGAAAQKQPRTVFGVRGCFAGMRAGRLGVSGRRIPGWLSPKQRLPVWQAGHRRRHRAATADAAPPEFVPPPRCRPPAA